MSRLLVLAALIGLAPAAARATPAPTIPIFGEDDARVAIPILGADDGAVAIPIFGADDAAVAVPIFEDEEAIDLEAVLSPLLARIDPRLAPAPRLLARRR